MCIPDSINARLRPVLRANFAPALDGLPKQAAASLGTKTAARNPE